MADSRPMPVTRRALLAGALAAAAAGCTTHHPDTPADPDAAVVASARDAERALLAAIDALIAGGSVPASFRLARADHAAHLAALDRRAGATRRARPSATPSAGSSSALLAAQRAGAAALQQAADAAAAGPTAALLASIAASHLAQVAPKGPLPVTDASAAGRPALGASGAGAAAPTRRGLQTAVAVEHQVVYGYGLAGARLTGRARRLALAALDAHATVRDALVAVLAHAGVAPTPAAPAYRPPFAVTDTPSALRLAVHLEDAAAGAAWDLVAAAAGGTDARRLAVGWLADSAVRDAQWRSLAGEPPEPALPGQPG